MDNVVSILKKNGFKITKVKKAVLDELLTSSTPLSVEELLGKIKESNIKVDRVSVYRTVSQLEDKNIAKKIELKEGKFRYESALTPHHHHLVCTHCGKITDIESKKVEKEIDILNALTQKSLHFMIDQHRLEFFGTCRRCINK